MWWWTYKEQDGSSTHFKLDSIRSVDHSVLNENEEHVSIRWDNVSGPADMLTDVDKVRSFMAEWAELQRSYQPESLKDNAPVLPDPTAYGAAYTPGLDDMPDDEPEDDTEDYDLPSSPDDKTIY